MSERKSLVTRIVSVIAATVIALACGTNVNNTSSFLLLLSLGCLGMCYVSVAFLRVVPRTQLYTPISTGEDRRSSNPLRRTKSKDDKPHLHDQEPGTLPTDARASPLLHHDPDGNSIAVETPDKEPNETSSLMSKSSSSSNPGDVPYEDISTAPTAHHDSHHLDIRGFALLKHTEFYQLWLLLGILTGVGLMTINNIGNDASGLKFLENTIS
ncbi:MAG: hypothetical protein Q9171_007379 [Xanthocarpia ochracea]